MRSKIFRSSMAVGVSVFVLAVALFMGMLYQYFSDQMTRELQGEAAMAARGVELAGMDYLTGLAATNRVTWVAADGRVLFDNRVDPATMENHRDRTEIQQALLGREGVCVRTSSTLSQRTYYVARRLDDGTVLRLAGAQHTVVALLLSMVQPMLIILAITLLIAMALAGQQTRRLVEPILNLDLEHPENGQVYEELAPLLTRIRRQNDTIRHQMELLRRGRQEFQALTDNMAEGFLLLDRRGRVLSFNNGALTLLDAPAPAAEASVYTLDRSDVFRRAVEQALAGVRSQGHLQRAGRYIQLLADPVRQEEKTVGAVLVLVDVTQREQGEKMRREFTANVSHELKTPLTAISGMAEIMKEGVVRPEDMAGFAGDIYKESQRLIALVEDIIHLSRLDEGGGDLPRQDVDLLALSRSVVQRLEPVAQAQKVTLTVRGESCSVPGVPSMLDEMVYNLCENAIKYNKPGGSVTLTAAPGPHGCTLAVKDTGIGIPAEDRQRVFERFYRVDKSRSKAIGGTGLGLSIVKHVAALHGAEITLDSRLGEGTEVRVVFGES